MIRSAPIRSVSKGLISLLPLCRRLPFAAVEGFYKYPTDSTADFM